jgi:hypothetical protein
MSHTRSLRRGTKPRKVIAIVSIVFAVGIAESLLQIVDLHDGRGSAKGAAEWPESIPALEPSAPSDSLSLTNVLHPILGIIRPPGMAVSAIGDPARLERMTESSSVPPWIHLTTNNYGYFANEDYPRTGVGDGEFTVGVFGGSVAQWLVIQSGGRILDQLRAVPSLSDRRIRLDSFAQGAFKQPQQLISLVYFSALGHTFDVVVNIDGFNEVALGARNLRLGIEAAMPSGDQLLPLVELMSNGPSMGILEAQIELRKQRGEVFRLLRLCRESPSAILRRIYRFRALRVVRRMEDSIQRLDEALLLRPSFRGIHVNPTSGGIDDAFDQLADTWQRSSRLMHQVCEARGISYCHIVQPNQYHSDHRFSSTERAVALAAGSPYAVSARHGYPLILDRISDLRSSGVSVWDATTVFDDVSRPVFSDSCCHLNQHGNDLLADVVVASIIDSLEKS